MVHISVFKKIQHLFTIQPNFTFKMRPILGRTRKIFKGTKEHNQHIRSIIRAYLLREYFFPQLFTFRRYNDGRYAVMYILLGRKSYDQFAQVCICGEKTFAVRSPKNSSFSVFSFSLIETWSTKNGSKRAI